ARLFGIFARFQVTGVVILVLLTCQPVSRALLTTSAKSYVPVLTPSLTCAKISSRKEPGSDGKNGSRSIPWIRGTSFSKLFSGVPLRRATAAPSRGQARQP